MALFKFTKAILAGESIPVFNRGDMLRETRMFLESVLLADKSVLDLLGADYTFVNERLADHYGMDGVFGFQALGLLVYGLLVAWAIRRGVWFR